jgi:hypothetical protein
VKIPDDQQLFGIFLALLLVGLLLVGISLSLWVS